MEKQAEAADRAQALWQALHEIGDAQLPKQLGVYAPEDLSFDFGAARLHSGRTDGNETVRAERSPKGEIQACEDRSLVTLRQRYNDAIKSLTTDSLHALREWPTRLKAITDEHYTYEVRAKAVEGNNYVESLSHQKIPKIAAPTYKSWGELLTFLKKENLPGYY